MASLSSPFPSANLAVRKPRTLASASAASNPSQRNKAAPDFVQGALMSAGTKRPWWAPIFRIGGSDPEASERKGNDPAAGSDRSGAERPKPPSLRSGLTEEKARVLRKEMRAMESWHDPMYHSAIAARLASPDHS